MESIDLNLLNWQEEMWIELNDENDDLKTHSQWNPWRSHQSNWFSHSIFFLPPRSILLIISNSIEKNSSWREKNSFLFSIRRKNQSVNNAIAIDRIKSSDHRFFFWVCSFSSEPDEQSRRGSSDRDAGNRVAVDPSHTSMHRPENPQKPSVSDTKKGKNERLGGTQHIIIKKDNWG